MKKQGDGGASALYAVIARRLEALELSERKASMKAGLGTDGIRNIRRGSIPRADSLSALAGVLKLDPQVLIDALPRDALIDSGAAESLQDMSRETIADAYVYVPTLDIKAGAGGGGFSDEDLMGAPLLMPRQLIEHDLRGVPSDFLVGDIEGQSMEPILMSGDRVLVDRRKVNPSQPGIFFLWDGYGLVAKWIERMAKTEPARLRIFSENKRFNKYDTLADQARIIGRVVWYARKL